MKNWYKSIQQNTTWIQEHNKDIIHQDQIVFIPGIMDGSVYENPIIISLEHENAFDEIQHHFMLNVWENSEIEDTYNQSNTEKAKSQHQTKWQEI